MKKRADIILIAGILIVAIVVFAVVKLTQKQGSFAVIAVDGVEIQEISLSKDGVYTLNGGTNTLEVRDGRAHMVDADCPDKLCMYMGYIDSEGQAIICLPNRLTVVVRTPDNGSQTKTDFTI